MNENNQIIISYRPNDSETKDTPYFYCMLVYNEKNDFWANTGCCGWSKDARTAVDDCLKEWETFY